jgi:hypothetical protein
MQHATSAIHHAHVPRLKWRKKHLNHPRFHWRRHWMRNIKGEPVPTTSASLPNKPGRACHRTAQAIGPNHQTALNLESLPWSMNFHNGQLTIAPQESCRCGLNHFNTGVFSVIPQHLIEFAAIDDEASCAGRRPCMHRYVERQTFAITTAKRQMCAKALRCSASSSFQMFADSRAMQCVDSAPIQAIAAGLVSIAIPFLHEHCAPSEPRQMQCRQRTTGPAADHHRIRASPGAGHVSSARFRCDGMPPAQAIADAHGID